MPLIIKRTVLPALILMAAALFLLSPMLFGDEKKEESAMAENSELMADSSAVSPESTYAEIDAGFKQLEHIFERSCFDCHTTRTRYPWYHKVPGIKQLLDSDIKEGLEKIDMSDGFPFKGKQDPITQANKLEEIRKELKEGDMPIFMYRMIHWGAAPTDAEKDTIYIWVDKSLMELRKLR